MSQDVLVRHATLGSLGQPSNAWPNRRMPGIAQVTKVARFRERGSQRCDGDVRRSYGDARPSYGDPGLSYSVTGRSYSVTGRSYSVTGLSYGVTGAIPQDHPVRTSLWMWPGTTV